MKNGRFICLLLLVSAMLAGCTSDHILHMRDGSSVVVEGKPHLDSATKMLMYTDVYGRTQAVNLEDVRSMSRLHN